MGRARASVDGPSVGGAVDARGARFLWRFDRWRHVLVLVGIVTLVRLVWTLWLSPYALSEDEAHYWEWSRRLDLSYYSKGPGIAWTIALSTSLLGDSVAGVRVLAPIFGGACALAVGALARKVYADPRAAIVAAGLALLIPAYQITSLLMTIDVAYLACWAIAALLAHRAIVARERRAWVGLGLTLGAGFLYKYTIVLLAIGIVVVLVARRLSARERIAASNAEGAGGTRGVLFPLIGLGLFALGMLPVVIWNARQGFPTVRHLLGHLGLRAGDVPLPEGCGGSDGFFPLWTLEFLGVQALIVGPAMGLMAFGVARVLLEARRGRLDPDDAHEVWGERLCACMGGPVLAFYFLVSLVSEGEANWSIAGYLTLLPIAAREGLSGMDRLVLLRERWREEGRSGREPANPRQVLLSGAIAYGLVAGAGVLLLDPISRAPVVRDSAIGSAARLDRLRRAPVLAERALEQARLLREQTGLEPIVIGSHYGRVSLLAFEFALRGERVEVYCASAVLPAFPDEGMCPGRRTQYDLWRDTNLRGAEVVDRLRGRPAVLLGGRRRQWQPAFADVSDLFEDGWDQDRVSFVARGFKGWE